MNTLSIFYSWQSGPYDRENRYFIGDCLKRAARELENEGLSVQIEQDTRGSAGSADIPQTVFSKIENAGIFVGDISIINQNAEQERKTPNPNVMIELGYAAGILKWERVLSVFNLRSGALEEVPFDIRNRRIIAYDTSRDIAEAKKALTEKLLYAIRRILTLPREDNTPAKASLARLIMDSLRYAWSYIAASDDDVAEPPVHAMAGCADAAPVVLDSHFQQASSLQEELTVEEFALLTDILDIIKKMRGGTEDAYGWEYVDTFARRCFEPVWAEYREEMDPVPMERCLQYRAVSLLNHLLPENQRIPYEAWRTTENGKKVFFADDEHLEAYSVDGATLINVDLDRQGRITGWKKERDYQGEFLRGVRHGRGTEVSRGFRHFGETRCSGRWEKGRFAEGTLCQAVLIKDDTAEDGFTYVADKDDSPLLLCDADLKYVLREYWPEDCENLYAADLWMHEGKFDISGTPIPLCPRKKAPRQNACTGCPKEEECE